MPIAPSDSTVVIVNSRYATQERERAPETAKAPFCDGVSGLRYYNPIEGRWLSRDPIGENGGVNLYGMVENNPLTQVDPFGLVAVIWVANIASPKPVETLSHTGPDGHVGVTWIDQYPGITCNKTGVTISLTIKAEYLSPNGVFKHKGVVFPGGISRVIGGVSYDDVSSSAQTAETQHVDDYKEWYNKVAQPLANDSVTSMKCPCDRTILGNLRDKLTNSLRATNSLSHDFWDVKGYHTADEQGLFYQRPAPSDVTNHLTQIDNLYNQFK